MAPTFKAITAFEQEYRAGIAGGCLEAAELFRFEALAVDIFRESPGDGRRLLAYILQSIFRDLSQRLDGEPGGLLDAGFFFKTLNKPVEAAIAALKQPLSGGKATRLAIELLDGRQRLLS
jgi:hypothetical protein